MCFIRRWSKGERTMRKVLFESGIYVGREGKGICCRTRHKTALCSECRIGYNHDNPNDPITVSPLSNSTGTVAAENLPSPSYTPSSDLISAVRDYIQKNRKGFRLLRLSKHLTLQSIAEVIGVAVTTVRGWEQGTFLPDDENAIRYLEILCPEVMVALTIEVQYKV